VSITVVNSEGGVGKLLTFQYVSQNLAQLEPNLIEGLLWYSSTNLIEGLLWYSSTNLIEGLLWYSSTNLIEELLWYSSTNLIEGLLWYSSTNLIEGLLWYSSTFYIIFSHSEFQHGCFLIDFFKSSKLHV
jgi:hypothetical protein